MTDAKEQAELRRLAPFNQRWKKAIKAAEQGDMTALADALSDLGLPMTDGARKMLGDFLARRKLSKKRGGQKIPIYSKSPRDQQVQMAVAAVRELQAKGYTIDKAIKIALKPVPMFTDPAGNPVRTPGRVITEDTLRSALRRKR